MNDSNTAIHPTERIAVFPGSFDPFTIGHESIVSRGLALFDRIIIAIGVNIHKPEAAERAAERAAAIAALYSDNQAVDVVVWGGLTADLANRSGARFILRGARSVADFEYERNIADINRQIAGLETVILFALPEMAAISSSTVRELSAFGHDITPFLPQRQ